MNARFSKAAGIIVAVPLPLFLVLGATLPLPDGKGAASLREVRVSQLEWEGVPLSSAIVDLNHQIAESGQTSARIYLDKGVDTSQVRPIDLKLDSLSAAECARYLSEYSNLFVYSVPRGIVIDYFHQDHRTWSRKYQDWVERNVL